MTLLSSITGYLNVTAGISYSLPLMMGGVRRLGIIGTDLTSWMASSDQRRVSLFADKKRVHF